MTKILVVDDNEMDRVLVTHLLSDLYQYIYACDGVEALEICDAEGPDLVVTDLVMPRMNGMEMLSELRERHPEIPVIMMTSEGNDSTAAEAMERGAASYVPKRYLSERLSHTVNQVVEVMRADRNYVRLLERLTYSRYAFELENDFSLIAPLVEFIQQIAFAEGLCGQGSRHRLGVAIDEALFNAMYHGNLELPPEHIQEVREAIRQDTTCSFVDQKCLDASFLKRRVYVHVVCTADQLKIVVEDQGKGFDHARYVKKNLKEFDSVQHRGLLLMASILDEVTYNDVGNRVTLIKMSESMSSIDETSVVHK